MNTFECVRPILVKMLSVNEEKITPNASLTNDLGADSLALVEISLAVEEQFGIRLDDEETFALDTVQQIVDCIEAKTAVPV